LTRTPAGAGGIYRRQETFLVEVGSVETRLRLLAKPKKEQFLKIIRADGKNGLRHLGML